MTFHVLQDALHCPLLRKYARNTKNQKNMKRYQRARKLVSDKLTFICLLFKEHLKGAYAVSGTVLEVMQTWSVIFVSQEHLDQSRSSFSHMLKLPFNTTSPTSEIFWNWTFPITFVSGAMSKATQREVIKCKNSMDC